MEEEVEQKYGELARMLLSREKEIYQLLARIQELEEKTAALRKPYFKKSLEWTARQVKRVLRKLKLIRLHDPKGFVVETNYLVLEKALLVLSKTPNLAVHLHVFFLDLLPEMIGYLKNIPYPYTCYVTTDSALKKQVIEYLLSDDLGINADRIHVIECENRGRDVGPWLVEMQRFNEKHDLWCHIHTKKSNHIPHIGTRWRNYLLRNLMGSPQHVSQLIGQFVQNDSLGLVFPPIYPEIANASNMNWDNYDAARSFLTKIGCDSLLPEIPEFPAGFMFWYRAKALQPLFDMNLPYSAFEAEGGQLRGTRMHLIERSLAYVSQAQGFSFLKCLNGA